MAVVIRFARHGKKNKPFYRIVAADKQYARNGRFLEVLGTYNPENKNTAVKQDRVEYWISQGAKPSETVGRLLKNATA